MKPKLFSTTIAALVLASSTVALAQDEPKCCGREAEFAHGHGGHDRGYVHPGRGPDHRFQDHGYGARPMGPRPGYDPYDHPAHFQRGQRLPGEYRNHQYVVDDWRGHHLARPPRGHQWVQVGGDYVLVAIATGLIANVLLNQ
jgi:Ni/Co efflux regulator RcnB